MHIVPFQKAALALAALVVVTGLVVCAIADVFTSSPRNDIAGTPVPSTQSRPLLVDTPLPSTPHGTLLTFLTETDTDRPLSANEATVKTLLVKKLTANVMTVHESDITTYPFDLNNDGRDEILAYANALKMCGSHGCHFYVYTTATSAASSAWQPIWFSSGDAIISGAGPIVVSEHRTHGFNDLLFGCQCDTDTCNDCRLWAYDGNKYQYASVVNSIKYGEEKL